MEECSGIIDFAGLPKTYENDYYYTLTELIDSTDIEFDGIKNTGLDKPLDEGNLNINLK